MQLKGGRIGFDRVLPVDLILVCSYLFFSRYLYKAQSQKRCCEKEKLKDLTEKEFWFVKKTDREREKFSNSPISSRLLEVRPAWMYYFQAPATQASNSRTKSNLHR